MPHLFRTDVCRLLRRVGFENPEIRPFDERAAGLLDTPTWPARNDWHFPWAVIRASIPD
jgi:hypothetical protein